MNNPNGGWDEMNCGLCGLTLPLPCGHSEELALNTVDFFADHSKEHRRRGEDPAYNQLLAELAAAGGAR